MSIILKLILIFPEVSKFADIHILTLSHIIARTMKSKLSKML